MKKKTLVIVSIIVGVCALGIISSYLIDWPVDTSQTSGDIAKSSKFSRKTAEEGLSNMQELMQNDEDYKNSIVVAYTVMQTRTKQFEALVDMSKEVAGDISVYEPVLKDMEQAKKIAANVRGQMEAAAKDIDATLGGGNPEDLAQNTNNAALAYSTLQKQNDLANRFIETTDTYLKDNAGSDRLKLVRDQWVDYQRMTAALNQDEKASEELEKKGYTLSSEKIASTMNSFDPNKQMALVGGAVVSRYCGYNSPLNNGPALNQTIDMVLEASPKLNQIFGQEMQNMDVKLKNDERLHNDAQLQNDVRLQNDVKLQNDAQLQNDVRLRNDITLKSEVFLHATDIMVSNTPNLVHSYDVAIFSNPVLRQSGVLHQVNTLITGMSEGVANHDIVLK
ncbi:MAG: hypothetical protein J5616_02960 [Bacteroidaceae bacterium]|nr:hypothetical protein [Bacteroidaceae bacterium]